MLKPDAAFLEICMPFKLSSLNTRISLEIGQQIDLSMSLEGLRVDVCCISETCIQDSDSVLQIHFPFIISMSVFYVLTSWNPIASVSDSTGVSVALSFRAEVGLINWFSIDSRLWAVRLKGSVKVRRNRRGKQCIFIIAYIWTDFSLDAIKDKLYHKWEIAFDKYRSTRWRFNCTSQILVTIFYRFKPITSYLLLASTFVTVTNMLLDVLLLQPKLGHRLITSWPVTASVIVSMIVVPFETLIWTPIIVWFAPRLSCVSVAIVLP